jgi:hypothetical protein
MAIVTRIHELTPPIYPHNACSVLCEFAAWHATAYSTCDMVMWHGMRWDILPMQTHRDPEEGMERATPAPPVLWHHACTWYRCICCRSHMVQIPYGADPIWYRSPIWCRSRMVQIRSCFTYSWSGGYGSTPPAEGVTNFDEYVESMEKHGRGWQHSNNAGKCGSPCTFDYILHTETLQARSGSIGVAYISVAYYRVGRIEGVYGGWL